MHDRWYRDPEPKPEGEEDEPADGGDSAEGDAAE